MFASLLLSAVAVAACPSALAFSPTQGVGHLKSIALTPTVGDNDVISINIGRYGSTHTKLIHNTQRLTRTKLASSRSNSDDDEKDKKKAVSDEIFWAKQRALAAQMEANSDAGLKKEQQDKFAKRRLALTSDTFYFSILIGSLLWLVAPNPFVTISYLFGALSGTAYSYGLGKYVETIGGSIDDTEAEGAGVGQARFAFLILLFVVVGKFRSQGLLEIPSIMGFFTYQLASLGQGLREIDD